MRFAIALIFSGFIVVAGSIVVYSVSVSTKDIMESAISDKLQEQAFHAMDKIDRAFYQRYYMAKILREELVEYFSEGKNPNTKDVAKLLAKFQSKHQVFTSLSFFDMDRLRLADSKGEDLGKIHSNSEPVEALDHATRQIGKGNFDVSVKIRSNDELGHLAESFNTMAAKLASSTKEVESRNLSLQNEISVRKEMEENLRDVLLERDLILETAKIGIALVVERKAVWINEHALELFGYTRDEWRVEESVAALYPSVEEFEAFGKLSQPVLEKGGIFHAERTMIKKNGTRIWCKLIGKLVDHNDPTKGGIWVLEDVTERRKAEEELRKAKERAEDATKLKDKFVSLVSHDLKAPLATMIGFLNLVKEDKATPLSDGVKNIISKAVDTGKQMSRLIDDLLNISRIKAGQVKLEMRFFDAKYIGAKMVSDYSYSALQKGVELKNYIPDNSRIYGDKTLLVEAVQNLVTNAIKFCRKGDSISIFLSEGDKTTLCIKDSGPGLEQGTMDAILKSTTNLSTSGSAGETGTGLGLSLAKDIMEFHKGELDGKCAVGDGCTFNLKLPYVRPIVLIADDDQNARRTQKSYLDLMDVEVLEAWDGLEALKLVANRSPHLVITDVQMPKLDGLELLEALKTNPSTKSVPVILVSGQHGMEIKDTVFKMGADDFITKKDMTEDFIPRLRRFLS